MSKQFPLLIHLGYPKTGTTWLQHELFVPSNEVFEPLSLKDNGFSTLAFSFITADDGYMLSSFDDNIKAIKREILKILKRKMNVADKTFVLSAERFSGIPHTGGYDAKTISIRLKKTFPEAKIFIVVREQKSFIHSSYFQYLSRGGIFSIKKYLNTKYDKRASFFSPHHIVFNKLIIEYQSLYGKENVLVLPYEMFKLEPQKYIERLGLFLGRKIDIKEESFNIQYNKKNYHFVLHYFRWLNLFLYKNSLNHYSIFKNRYTRRLAFYTQTLLGKATPKHWNTYIQNKTRNYITQWTSNRFEEPNKELSELIDIDLSKYNYHS